MSIIKELDKKILSPGKRIKYLRKKLNLKQKELTNGEISRSLISYIENEKIKLMNDTAKIIANCLNVKAKEKGVELNITDGYLLKSEENQAVEIVDNIIKKLKKSLYKNTNELLEDINRVEEISKNWDITDRRANFYELLGDYYYDKRMFDEAHVWYFNALENNIKLKEYINIIGIVNKLSKCAIKNSQFKEAISLNNYGLSLIKNLNIKTILPNDLLFNIKFNIVLAYKKLGNFKEALKIISSIEKDFKLNNEQICDLVLLRGNCFLNLGEYSKAEKQYNIGLNIANALKDKTKVAMYFNNLGAVMVNKGDLSQAISYFKQSLDIKENIKDKIYISKTYLNIGKAYYKLGKYKESKKYLFKGFNKIDNNDNNLKLTYYKYMSLMLIKEDNINALYKIVNDLPE